MPISLPGIDLAVKDLIEGAKWVGGTLFAAVLVLWRVGKKVGASQELEQQRYKQLRDDIDLLKDFTSRCITGPEHVEMQRLCRSDLEHLIDTKINNVVLDIRDELNVMNSNICRIMGSLNVQPIEQNGKARRRTD
jgi:hypothetical protein